MNARNAFINSGSFLASSTSLINAFTVFHLYSFFVVMTLLTQLLYLNVTAKSSQILYLENLRGICELFDE